MHWRYNSRRALLPKFHKKSRAFSRIPRVTTPLIFEYSRLTYLQFSIHPVVSKEENIKILNYNILIAFITKHEAFSVTKLEAFSLPISGSGEGGAVFCQGAGFLDGFEGFVAYFFFGVFPEGFDFR